MSRTARTVRTIIHTDPQTSTSAPVGGTPDTAAPVAAPVTEDATPDGDCPVPSASTVDAASNPGEPVVSLPLPDGWNRATELEDDDIRLALVEEGKEFQDSGMVAVFAEASDLPHLAAIDEKIREGMGDDASDYTRHPEGETCGFPSVRVDGTSETYSGDVTGEVPSTNLLVAVPDGRGAFVVGVSVVGADAVTDEILAGLGVHAGD